MSIMISDDAMRVLRTIGWNEAHRTEIASVEAFLELRGFQVSPVAAEFLRTFHGFAATLTNRGGLSFVDFDVVRAVGGIEPEDKPFIDALADAPPCPIGYGGGVLLFVTSGGEMLLLNDQWLGFSLVPSVAEGMDIILGVRRTSHYDGVSLGKEQIPPGFR